LVAVTVAPWDVTAVIVTRGDCDLEPILASLIFDDVVIWNNEVAINYGAYGRYVAIRNHAKRDVVYVQDDDCIVSEEDQLRLVNAYEPGILTAMMPPERIDYLDTVLVGWGAIFDRGLPDIAFERWIATGHEMDSRKFQVVGADFVFPILTPWKRLDGYHQDLPHAHAENRTWASFPDYGLVKEAYLNEGRRIRDGG
jgi:hypothetical protein